MSCHWGKILTGLPSDELQQQVITYRTKENCVLEAQLNGHRLRLTDTNPRRLAALARQLGRTRLQAITTPATPIFDGFCWANDIRSTTALKNWCIALKVLRTSSVEPVVLLPTASESQCLLRAVCAFDQGGCTSSDDQHGGRGAAPCADAISGVLSCRAESSGSSPSTV